MKNKFTKILMLACFACLTLCPGINSLMAQCVNADFSDGNFTGWTGTYFANCTDSLLGNCLCSATNPFYKPGFNQGPNNSPVNDFSVEYNEVITTAAAGIDSNLARMGVSLPVVWPIGSGYSARSGTMWQAGESGMIGQGETMSYTFTVTPGNCNFAYHYAVVLDDGGHLEAQQAYFSVKMVDGNNNDIVCGEYNVDATTCQTIGGFTRLNDPLYGDNIYYKPWTTVLVPLASYIGQTITITFITRSCLPSGCAGSHYGYSYFSCECLTSDLLHLALTPGGHCGSPMPAISAPNGFATYTWTGPGIIGSGNTQTISIYQPGNYSVEMTTMGSTPCVVSLDTLVPDSLGFFVANFSASTGCLDSTVIFTDRSSLHDSITSWAWDFNNDGVTDATIENPSYVFPGVGTYPVKLTITSASCIRDTVINVTVVRQPVVTLTAGPPACAGSNVSVLYTVNDPNAYNFTYNWNFDSATYTNDTGFGGYLVQWYTAGTKNITLTVVDSNCAALPVGTQVVVKPYPNLGLPLDTGLCAGGSITLAANGAATYAWNADSTLSDTSTATVTATPDTTTTYVVTGTLNGCSATDWVTVQVATPPVFTAIGGVTDSVCVNDTLLLGVACTAGNNAVYTWNVDGAYAQVDTTVTNALLVDWPTAGAKTVIVSVNNNGCVASDSTIVYVIAGPALTLIGDTAGCLGNQITLTATGASAYVWAVDTLLFTTGSITFSLGSPTTSVVVTGTNSNECATTDSVTVTANTSAVISFATSGLVCVGDTITVTFTGSAVAGATFNWNFGYGSANTLTGPGPVSVSWDSVGFCLVSLTVSQFGCVSSFADTIPVQICSGIRPINTSEISIYPNPAKNDFTIEVTGAINNARLEINDVLGRVLYTDAINGSTGVAKQIHLNVATGVYFVSVYDGDKHYTQKLVIE